MSTKLSRKPDDVLRRVGAGGTMATVNRIMKTWDRATPSDVEAGSRWYGEDSGAILRGLVAAGGGSMTLQHAAAVVSHLSPRTSWGRNVAGAYALVTGGVEAARELGCISRNVELAQAALESEEPLATLNGPKTKRFAWNLLGYREAVTVDVWAARVALGDTAENPERILGLTGVYDALEHCYRLAARRAGVDPTTMQATTWVVARNGRAA